VTTIGWGVGGRSVGQVARGGRLELGPLAVDAPLLTLPSSREGPTSMRDVAGNLGGGLLARFTVAFDYTRRQVHLWPNARFGQPFAHDRAGLWINRHRDGAVVAGVQAQGPADDAGVREGDIVVAIDGDAATALSLDDLRARLRADTPAVRLRVSRGGPALELTLSLRDLVPARMTSTGGEESA
jgi:hypothetical protein